MNYDYYNIPDEYEEGSFLHGMSMGRDYGYDRGIFEGKKEITDLMLGFLKNEMTDTIDKNDSIKQFLVKMDKFVHTNLMPNLEPNLINNFIEEKDRIRLIEIINESESAGLLKKSPHEMVHSNDGRIMLWDSENLEFWNIVKKYLNQVSSNYKEKLYPHNIAMMKYYPGTGLALHTDNDGICRKTCSVTSVIYLNDDYEGGEVSFPIINKDYSMTAGSIMHFPQKGLQAYHSVGDLLSGNRYIILTCYTDNQSIVNQFYKDFYND
jgi:hypothetical protein